MDKIKPYLQMLKQHHFWLLAGICVVVMLYCWNTATQEIEQQFSANKVKVEGEFGKIQKLNSREQFPNPKWQEAAVQKDKEVVQQIEAASQRIVKRQQPSLEWPAETFSEAFIEVASKESPATWPDLAIAEFKRAMPDEVKRLRKIIDAADTIDDPGVQWNKEDYEYIQSAFTFRIEPARQTVIKMRKVFWVLESLAKIVAVTNEGVEDRFNLPIHNLELMGVGPERASVDAGEWAVSGLEGKADLGQEPEVSGYDIWPVRLRVRMDLKYLNRLLTACANSELSLDVTGVRFEHLNRSVEVEVEEPPSRRFNVGGGFRGFGGAGPPVQPRVAEAEKEEPKPSVPSRGTLVEIVGFVYIADEQLLKDELAKPAPPVKEATPVKASAPAQPAEPAKAAAFQRPDRPQTTKTFRRPELASRPENRLRCEQSS